MTLLSKLSIRATLSQKKSIAPLATTSLQQYTSFSTTATSQQACIPIPSGQWLLVGHLPRLMQGGDSCVNWKSMHDECGDIFRITFAWQATGRDEKSPTRTDCPHESGTVFLADQTRFVASHF